MEHLVGLFASCGWRRMDVLVRISEEDMNEMGLPVGSRRKLEWALEKW